VRRVPAPVAWGAVVGVVTAASPLAFWWLDPSTVYALGLVLIAAVYVGFAVADGRPKVIVAESTVASVFVVIAAVAVSGSVWLIVAGASRFVHDPPGKVAVPLAVGAWVNANAFGVLAFRPELKDHPVYKTGVVASFVSASWGFTGLAAVAWKRWLKQR
jgi:hypothetical protein